MKSDRQFKQLTMVMGVMLTLGVVAWAYSLVTTPNWGILLTNFVYFVGITEAAMVFAVILKTVGAHWVGPLYRFGGLLAISFIPLALIMLILIFLGQGAIFYWIGHQVVKEGAHNAGPNPWLNPFFFVIRETIAFGLFYFFAWSIFKTAVNEDENEPHTARRLLFRGVPLMIIFVVHQSILGWDLGMTLNARFLSTVYTMAFWIGNIYGGIALLILSLFILRRFININGLKDEQFTNMAHLLLAFSIFWIYFTWADFFPFWYANIPSETAVVYLKIFSQYGGIYAVRIPLAVIPFIMLTFSRVRNSVTTLASLTVPILIGLWLERYLMIVPPLVKAEKMVDVSLGNPVNILFSLGILAGFIISVTYAIGRFENGLGIGEAEA